MLSILKNRFVRLNINSFEFDGKAAFAIFISDVTRKTARKVNELDIIQKHQINQMAENLTSTVSHEMQTPLSSILFFIAQLEIFIAKLIEMGQPADQAIKFLHLIKSQLMLMQTFVSDLLDMR